MQQASFHGCRLPGSCQYHTFYVVKRAKRLLKERKKERKSSVRSFVTRTPNPFNEIGAYNTLDFTIEMSIPLLLIAHNGQL